MNFFNPTIALTYYFRFSNQFSSYCHLPATTIYIIHFHRFKNPCFFAVYYFHLLFCEFYGVNRYHCRFIIIITLTRPLAHSTTLLPRVSWGRYCYSNLIHLLHNFTQKLYGCWNGIIYQISMLLVIKQFPKKQKHDVIHYNTPHIKTIKTPQPFKIRISFIEIFKKWCVRGNIKSKTYTFKL